MSVRRLGPVQPESFVFIPENLQWAEDTMRNYPEGKQAAAVLPVLWRAQEQNGGWISKAAIEYVAHLLGMSYIRVYEVATFYTMFQLSPVGKRAHLQVCGTTPCMLRGAEGLIEVCRKRIHGEPHHVSPDGNFSWEEVECLGACVNAPMILIGKDTYEDLTPDILDRILDGFVSSTPTKPGPQNGRQTTAPLGALTSLTDKSLYDGTRTFTRVEIPQPSPASVTSPKVQENAKAKKAEAIAKAPAAPADPAKSASVEAKKVANTDTPGQVSAGTQTAATAAAEAQRISKETPPGKRAVPRRSPVKKDGK